VEVHAPGEDETRSSVRCSEFTKRDTQHRRTVSRRLVAVLHTHNRKRNTNRVKIFVISLLQLFLCNFSLIRIRIRKQNKDHSGY
jgi:hypothetical protein